MEKQSPENNSIFHLRWRPDLPFKTGAKTFVGIPGRIAGKDEAEA